MEKISTKFKVLCAFDSFKDCISAEKLGKGLVQSLLKHYPEKFRPEDEHFVVSFSDGGEGFLNAIKHTLHMETRDRIVVGPLGEPISAQFGVSTKASVAVVEMAQASGLESVPADRRNPLLTTSFGTGQLIKEVAELGIEHLILGVGGSATVDGGLGALQALGIEFEMDDGAVVTATSLPLTGKDLNRVRAIAARKVAVPPKISIAFDVENPLLGPTGAVAVYGPQKGASTPAMQNILEEGLSHLMRVICTATCPAAAADRYHALCELRGGGAAGGIVASLHALVEGCSLSSGAELLAETMRLGDKMARADVVFSGEGSIDAQTEYGKALAHIRRCCGLHHKPLVTLCGRAGGLSVSEAEQRNIYALTNYFPLSSSLHEPLHCIDELVRTKGTAILAAIQRNSAPLTHSDPAIEN